MHLCSLNCGRLLTWPHPGAKVLVRPRLTGHIVERQRDRDTGEWKSLVAGQTLTDDPVVVVVKISATGKLVFITVFLA